ncbi:MULTISPECIES: polyprenyl synthetase family protein [Leuconostoc]|uniref:Polyprenyl synthetase family protein n=2 Tax=Leuconostoc pseudomesenteroides TaxID=33968 RepID=A0A5B8T053_LEUPS|nr:MULTISPECIES: polyprenyl synthetase family protein [Leuconostoc]MCC8440212.1 polyprenyl synthetase family protein [Leuconostoc pseudomesenteroides]MDG9733880.1 polyprenyl synthetase family protein [Leuconostoc pseudomesenteroides]MDN2451210.1 polyprenyl synthetase family protein [Leuconostoc sp. UCMA20149]NKZ37116.1 polyprenyl synthetase family protein [Leuconostoc pseudomesenteroides]QEA42912.1 polyprenyl synthetase family protein [Leuconostoc pseudomesenteroides]
MTNLKKFQNEWLPKINAQLENDLSQVSSDDDLVAMMKYAVLNGGKRLRPLLTLMVLESFEQLITPSQLKIATAVEWIHSYSLVHDDLPAMDNDLLRRGKPSVHALYGEANAILVGDALLTGAFTVIPQALTVSGAPASESIVLITQYLSQAAGANGMVLGQIHDMQNHDGAESDFDQESLLSLIYQPKTAALLRYAAQAGALLVKGSANDETFNPDLVTKIADFGEKLGLAFQIQDDLDDFQQDTTESVNALPHLVGVTTAERMRDDYLNDAYKILNDIKLNDQRFHPELLSELITFIGDKS